MTEATACAAASIQIDTDRYQCPSWTLSLTDRVLSRYIPVRDTWLTHAFGASWARPEEQIRQVEPLYASWLPVVQGRIVASTATDASEMHEIESGQFLKREIVDAALQFFEKASDVLPGEPYIYASKTGDLVAEFEAPRGTMTTIVSKSFALAFAVIAGEQPLERRFALADDSTEPMRSELKALSDRMRTEQNGGMETETD
jgi:hypothetical protein